MAFREAALMLHGDSRNATEGVPYRALRLRAIDVAANDTFSMVESLLVAWDS